MNRIMFRKMISGWFFIFMIFSKSLIYGGEERFRIKPWLKFRIKNKY